MYLKRIELAGFKSFADKTEMEFVRGITAVVGPNGSGKSNISDGIRWVLGEQSAKSLRGGKMEDIIFAGSDARKAVNYGEVSLTLDNTDHVLALDFGEVTVTRRVHRSGDSEYLINRQPCRLKDITELFMDTGIGKEAYSIIGQGRIEEILSTRSEDRRGIFEEASGIVKYKSRKKEANRKLADTEQNLLRIHDLVTELEDQIGPLKQQAEKAQRYKTLKEELKDKEIALFVYQIGEIHRAWTEASNKLAGLEEQRSALAEIVEAHDRKLDSDRQALRAVEDEIEELQSRLLRYSELSEKSEGYAKLLEERRRNLEQSREQLKAAIESDGERFDQRKQEAAFVQSRLNAAKADLELLRAELSAEQAKLTGVTEGISHEQEEKLKGDLLELMNKMAQTRNEIRYADQQKEGVMRRMNRVDEESGRWEAEKEKLEREQSERQSALEQASRDIAALRRSYIEESEKLHALQKKASDSSSSARKWEQKREALVSRRDTMKEMQEDFEGFMAGVKEVLRASRSRQLEGVHGAVAELITVPQQVETAIETALGASLQHIVMENEALSRKAIGYLKQRQLGRATFLPLDVIRPRHMSESDKRAASGAQGFVGIGAELVQADERYGGIVGSLLGGLVVAEHLEDANGIASRLNYRYRVVTLDGDLVNAGGSMTGGSQNRRGGSLLGRKRALEQLDREIKESEREISRLSREERENGEQAGQSEVRLGELRERGDSLRAEEQRLDGELKQTRHGLRHVNEQFALHGEERSGYAEELESAGETRQKAERRLKELEAEEAANRQAIAAAEFARKAGESAKEELQGHLTELRVQESRLGQETASLEERLSRLGEENGTFSGQLADRRKMLRGAEAELAANIKDAEDHVRELKEAKELKSGTQETLDEKRLERTERQRNLQERESETHKHRGELKTVEESIRHTEIQATRLDVELENTLQKLTEEYGIGYELAQQRYELPEDPEAARLDVREIKRGIALLGEVNLGAIEEYERVSERYNFLSEQKNDLMEAKAQLYLVIREMDEEMSKRFKTTFDSIRRQFGSVFSKLFGGGRADLVLLDPDNMLETGIDIVAQPPGKKLQNLQLLSGGERALTAMALLFAILHVKPVPFCVLDEVEAALDESNVTRFAQYLREFAEQTQFIVVTHRKGTMEEADVLYGVTMEEGGVSKLVSVKLEDEEIGIA
ncbi:chromosome segregation protein SMC [Saccharibacillus sp. CPCC 101409]|uniref:chromosome segregation protein SMC n=1 Tax=Saccharibacillus sp. CPCC 101409 TaxID=3058041 RepID=UPI0026721ED2|nr:chromosome segregation protein SMC [Saccharibacillus sp. CPCC 101409]MDO3410732.1 chromosome segregation protein SMC [Saccharibacillus sp. CPCC 101409]